MAHLTQLKPKATSDWSTNNKNQILPTTGKESPYRQLARRIDWLSHKSRVHETHIRNTPEAPVSGEQGTLYSKGHKTTTLKRGDVADFRNP